jgi:hypothetical protein
MWEQFMDLKKIFTPKSVLFLFVILNLVIGIFIVSDYGVSMDESYEGRRSKLALKIYSGELNEKLAETYDELGHTQYYGTASTVIIRFVEKIFFRGMDHSRRVVAHYMYFVFFQASIIAIFYLGKQLFDEWISLVVAVMFGTQPLLFGHAFINPKDIPLLTVFLLTVVTGFYMVDNWLQRDSLADDKEKTYLGSSGMNQGKKQRLFAAVLIFLVVLLWSSSWINKLILNAVEFSYNTQETSFLGKLFSSMTTYGSLEGYLTLTSKYIIQVNRWAVFSTPIVLLIIIWQAQKHKLFGGYVNLKLLLGAAKRKGNRSVGYIYSCSQYF